jgi:hypothetical protein
MRIAVPLLALLLIGTLPVAALGGTDTGARTLGATPVDPGVHQQTGSLSQPDVTEIRLAPDPEGDARWRITVRYPLPTDAERAAFERFAGAFERGEAEVGLDVAFFRTLADEASRTTDRPMEIRNPSRNATLANDTGILRFSFTWTNFVTGSENGFAIRDAVLMPDDRTWLSSIGPRQRLVIETPSGYRVSDTRFGLDNGSVVVDGPHTFEEPLTISYRRSAPNGEDGGLPWSPVAVLGVAVLAVLALGGAYARRRDTDPSEPAAGERPTEGETAPAEEPEPPTAPPTESGADAVAAETPDEADDGADETADLSLLSDEERVERLLERNGGRMKQARIVEETGWSDAKVSQLLTSMADEGRIEKLRLGRENLISLPDEEPP